VVVCSDACPHGLMWDHCKVARCAGCALPPQVCLCHYNGAAAAWPLALAVRFDAQDLSGWMHPLLAPSS